MRLKQISIIPNTHTFVNTLNNQFAWNLHIYLFIYLNFFEPQWSNISPCCIQIHTFTPWKLASTTTVCSAGHRAAPLEQSGVKYLPRGHLSAGSEGVRRVLKLWIVFLFHQQLISLTVSTGAETRQTRVVLLHISINPLYLRQR